MWKTVKLDDIADVKAGNPAPQDKNFFENGVYPFVRTSDVGKVKVGSLSDANDKLNQQGIAKLKLFPKGTILFPKSGASTFLNHRVILEMDAYVASHLATIKSKQDNISDKYLWYFLQTIDAADLVADSSYPSLNTKTIQSISVPLPPLEEQERIVARLDAAFAEIDGAVEKAQAKVKEIKKFKDSMLASMLNNNYWEEFKLAEICTKITDGSHNPPKGVTFSDFLMLSSKNVFDDAINFEKPRFLKEEDYIKENKRTDVQEGDVFLTIVGTIGRCAVVNDSLKPFTLQRSVAVLKPAHDLVLSRFLMYLLQDKLQILLQGARGVA